eukprot:2250054-Rhodomonas_salina.2
MLRSASRHIDVLPGSGMICVNSRQRIAIAEDHGEGDPITSHSIASESEAAADVLWKSSVLGSGITNWKVNIGHHKPSAGGMGAVHLAGPD